MRVMSWTRVLSDTTEHHVKTVGCMYFRGQYGLPRVFAEAAQDRKSISQQILRWFACSVEYNFQPIPCRGDHPVQSEADIRCFRRFRAYGRHMSEVRWPLKRFRTARQSLRCLPVFNVCKIFRISCA